MSVQEDLPYHEFETFFTGNPVTRNITWEPGGSAYDFTGVSVTMNIFQDEDSQIPDLSLTTENGGISYVDAANGQISFTITDEQADDLAGLYTYELFLTSTNDLILLGKMDFTRKRS